MASPPKPWERAGATGAGTTTVAAPSPANKLPLPATSTAITAPASVTNTPSSAAAPVVPPRPDSLSASVAQNASAHSRPTSNPYNPAYQSPYSSPYSRMGGMGGMGGYGYGNYGGYGGYGGMYGNSMYGGMPGMMPNDPNNPNSLTNRFGSSTQATFQMLEGIVGAFGGFAQMLESTYMATHSSFFAMVSVAEQFSNLRETLGSVLGIFTIMRWIRTLLAKITGRPLPADAMALTPSAFASFEGRKSIGPNGATKMKPSRKPLVFFLLAAFGLPYLMSKAIRSLAASAQEDERKRMQAMESAALDPSKLEFCRVLYDFTPEAGNATQGVDLAVKKGDFIAVLSKNDPLGNPSEWWRCRARDGRLGYLPATFLTVARRPDQPAAIKAAPESAPSPTLSAATTAGSPPDLSAEAFQKSQFYS